MSKRPLTSAMPDNDNFLTTYSNVMETKPSVYPDKMKKKDDVEKETISDNTNSAKRVRVQTKRMSDETVVLTTKPVLTLSSITIYDTRQPIPKRNDLNELVFPDYPNFRPNLTPKEILQLGSFGGTYFRPIKSSVTGLLHKDEWKEFPADWFEGLDIKKYVTSSTYNKSLNKFKESCGGDLDMWESSGWIRDCDPYGWFQWYCRFYLGRRCSDDDRQVDRGLGVIGKTGRWRRNLMNKCIQTGTKPEQSYSNTKISPKIRQLLQV